MLFLGLSANVWLSRKTRMQSAMHTPQKQGTVKEQKKTGSVEKSDLTT
jgi:hypothetical protein